MHAGELSGRLSVMVMRRGGGKRGTGEREGLDVPYFTLQGGRCGNELDVLLTDCFNVESQRTN